MGHKEDIQAENAPEIAELQAQVGVIRAELQGELDAFVLRYKELDAQYQPLYHRLNELFVDPGPVHSNWLTRAVLYAENASRFGWPVK